MTERDFNAERAALHRQQDEIAKATRQLQWDLIKHLYGVGPGSLVRDFEGRVCKITGLEVFAWYPAETPISSGVPGHYVYELPAEHIRPLFTGVRMLKKGGFGDAEHNIHSWTKLTDEEIAALGL